MAKRCQTCLELLELNLSTGSVGHVTVCQVRTPPRGIHESIWYDSFRWTLNPSRADWCAEPFGEYAFYAAEEMPQ